MKDLFGSISFIKFNVLETILSSSDAVNKLFYFESEDILKDYLSNMDSYLYGLILLPIDNINEIKIWIRNYIKYLYIPLIERDSLYILKSNLIKEILNINDKNSKVSNKVKEFLQKEIYGSLKSIVLYKHEEVKLKLDKMSEEDSMLLFKNYCLIYNDLII